MLTVYVGYDSTQDIAFEVCKRSILHYNPLVNVIKIDRKELKDAGLFWREDNTGSTEFTYTRFLVPYLNNYKGWALFCDSDFLWKCNIDDIMKYAKIEDAVSCVQHEYNECNGHIKMNGKSQEYYPRKNWSSLMLFNCSHPDCLKLNPQTVSTQTPAWLHRISWTDAIGAIDKSYNYLVGYYDDECINALHFTDGGPWFKEYENVQYGEEWRSYLYSEENV